jgi:FtsH-binding integral membrane protein
LRGSALLAAALAVLGTALLVQIEPGSAHLRLFPVLFGVGSGMMTIVRAASIVELATRTAFGAVNGAIALPALAGTALAPLAAAELRSLSGGDDAVLVALLVLAATSLAGLWWATSGPRAA